MIKVNIVEERIIKLIDKIRPFIISDGGNIDFIKYENNIVYVKLSGACAECDMIDSTLNNGIEEILKNEIPEIKDVINIS